MSQASPLPQSDATADGPSLGIPSRFARHLLCLSLPLVALVFVATGPHVWWVALLWLLPMFVFDWADARMGRERRPPHPEPPEALFDGLLYLLVALQFVVIALFLRTIAVGGLFTIDALVGLLIISGNSGFSAIVVAHELIHRRRRAHQLLGRALLVTVLYEHFFTEHLRGHHARVATPDDPATARFGETWWAFVRRTIPGQFRSAWRLEAARLGDAEMPWYDRRLLRSRVVHGLALEAALLAALLVGLGPAVTAAFALQAAGAVLALEAVNYFEHWGLERRGPRPSPADSWDTDSWFTYWALVGLSRHADHHAHATRPYTELRLMDEAPLLPTGYLGMVNMVQFRNRKCRELLTDELRRRQLGPFDPRPAWSHKEIA